MVERKITHTKAKGHRAEDATDITYRILTLITACKFVPATELDACLEEYLEYREETKNAKKTERRWAVNLI